MIDKIKALAKEYLLPAFKITNKEIKIYLVIVLFALINFSSGFFKTHGIFTLLFMLFQFLGWAYSLSVPIFFSRYLEEQKIEPDFMVKKTLGIIKRLIIPSIVLYILFMFSIFVVFGVGIALRGTMQKITVPEMQSYYNLFYNQLINFHRQPLLYIILIPVTLVISLFTFQTMFFALRQRGFFRSFIDSFRFSLKNREFIIMITIYSFFIGLISFVSPYPANAAGFTDFNFRLILFLISLVMQYFYLIRTGAATLYFLDKENK